MNLRKKIQEVLTQAQTENGVNAGSGFILDRVMSSFCDCTKKIPVDSNARCFTCFSSGSSSTKVVDFFLNLCLVCVIAWA
jgi:hypothetical protein